MAKKTKKRKKTPTTVVRPSPLKYIKSQSRSLPVYRCHITENWAEMGLATVIVARQQPSGNFVVGTYLVDTFCLGVKDTYYRYNATRWDYQELLEQARYVQEMIPCDYALAHNVVYGAVSFAEELGFTPHKDFDKITQYILEEDIDAVEFIDLEFGRDGEPVLFVKEGMNPTRYIKQLDKSVGEGNYDIVYQEDTWDDDDWGEADGLPLIDEERPLRALITLRAEEAQRNYVEEHGTTALSLETMKVIYEPMETEYDRRYADELPALRDTMTELYELAQDDPPTALPSLRRAVEKYPQHPIFQNYLYLVLSRTGQQEAAHQLTLSMYEHCSLMYTIQADHAQTLATEKRVGAALMKENMESVVAKLQKLR